MKHSLAIVSTCLIATAVSAAQAQEIKRDIPYATPAKPRQVLDIYAPANAKKLPVVVWIHGGGWVVGDKSDVQEKPKGFTDKGFVFVSTNYRLLPNVDMATIIEDIATSIGWVHKNIAQYGGDPDRIFVMGHSAGAQLAAIVCVDERYLKAAGVPFTVLKGCVPVDGDTYDVPAIIETAETRHRVYGLPPIRNGHREKFGNDPVKHRDYSAVNHVAKGKGIPPFLIMHVGEHPDTTAQANRLGNVLRAAGVPMQVYGARDSSHNRVNGAIGVPGTLETKVVFDFVEKSLSNGK